MKNKLSARLRLSLLILIFPCLACAMSPGRAEREKSGKLLCELDLREIGFALQEYKKANGHFPPAVVRDEASGTVHSWRVAILPYLGDWKFYREYRLNEPWDSEANKTLYRGDLPFFCPVNYGNHAHYTNYLMVVRDSEDGKSCCDDAPGDAVIVVEVKASDIYWSEPRDLPLDTMSFQINGSGLCIGSKHPGGAHVLHCDGTVEFLSETLSAERVRELLEVGRGKENSRSAPSPALP
jgi:prepilin-type processing-associated H-X9-DG protein